MVRRALLVLLVLALCAGLWEGYRAVARATDGNWPFTEHPLPLRSTDQTMPALGDIASRMFEPQQRGGDTTVFMAVVESSWFTFRVALAGLVAGTLIGMALAIVMLRAQLLERALLPYVIASQTVPLIALAPVVVSWGNRAGWETWTSVSLIATYLTFFPVAVNGLRGLKSPRPEALDLMKSCAASWWDTLLKLRLPAAVPYLIPALKLAATASVVGAIVGEISTGIEGGIGRLLISYMQQASTDPPKLYAAIIGAAGLGLAFVALINLLDRFVGSPPAEELA
jgi:NitT/TauT family transport system permease protein